MDVRYQLTLPVDGISTQALIDSFHVTVIKPSSFSFHLHTAFETYFVEEGSMRVFVEGEELNLKKGDILLIYPQVMHRVAEASEDLCKLNLRFLFLQTVPRRSDVKFVLLQTEAWRRSEIFQNIACISRQLKGDNSKTDSFRIRTYLSLVLHDLVAAVFPKREEKGESDSQEKRDRLALSMQIDSFFAEKYGEPITISALAERLHYSPTHVNRLLKDFWGLTFGEKLKQTRLHKAKELLSTTTLSVGEIAEACGYSTLRGFELFFVKGTGLLPGQYRGSIKDK